jgi:hypothetical protein
MSDWIPRIERMPEDDKYVLVALARDIVYSGDSDLDVMHWSPDLEAWHDGSEIYIGLDKVTHWMALPILPPERLSALAPSVASDR